MKFICFIMIYFNSFVAHANDEGTVLLYEPMTFPGYYTNGNLTSGQPPKPKTIDKSIFENTMKEAILILENSMRHTCAKEMETSISITAEGKWAVVGVSITGAIKLIIANPEMSKKCGK